MSLLGATPVTTGPQSKGANCILELLSTANSAKLAAEGATFIETGRFSANAGTLLTPAPTCMALHRWTEVQTQLAGRYTIAKLALPSAEAALRHRGTDTAKLNAIYRGLPSSTRARALERADAAALLAKAQSAGLVKRDSDLPMLGRYIGLLNLVDAIPAMLDSQ